MSRSRTFKAILLASGETLTLVLSLSSMAVLVRIFSKEDFALYRQTRLAYEFAAPLLALGLPQALFYFLPGRPNRPRPTLMENLVPLALMGAVFSLFLVGGGNRLLAWRFHNPDLAHTLKLFAPYPLFALPAGTIGACLMARDRPGRLALYNVASRTFLFGVIIAAALLWRSPAALITASAVAMACVSIPAIALMLHACPGRWARPTLAGMRAQLAHSIPLSLSSMINGLSRQLDKIVVAAMCPASAFAVYAVGAMEVPLAHVINRSVTSVLLPEFAALHRAGNHADILKLWHRSMIKSARVIFPMMVFLLLAAPLVITTLFSARYEASIRVFQVYLILLPIRIANFSAVFQAAGRTRALMIRAGVALATNAVLTVLLVKHVGYMGACIATCLSIYAWTVPYSVFVSARILHTKAASLVPWRPVLKIAVLSCLPAAVFWLPLDRLVSHNAVRLLILAAAYGGGLLLAFQLSGEWYWKKELHDILQRRG